MLSALPLVRADRESIYLTTSRTSSALSSAPTSIHSPCNALCCATRGTQDRSAECPPLSRSFSSVLGYPPNRAPLETPTTNGRLAATRAQSTKNYLVENTDK